MQTPTLIQCLKNTLSNKDVPIVLAALRQDSLLWASLQQPEFLERLTKQIGMVDIVQRNDWSPARLAMTALHQPYQVTNPMEAVDAHLLKQLSSGYPNILKLTDKIDLSKAAAVSIVLANRQQETGSWSFLAEEIDRRPDYAWETSLACLYGLVNDPQSMLHSLASQQPSRQHSRLAIHVLLCQPADMQSRILLLADVTHAAQSNYPDLPLEHLDFIQILNEQNTQLAIAYCKEVISQQPSEPYLPIPSPFHQTEILRETANTLRNLELSRLADDSGRQTTILNKLLSLINILSSSILAQITDMQTPSSESALDTAHSINVWKQAIEALQTVQPISATDPFKAGLALALVEKGEPSDAISVLSTNEMVFSADPFQLIALIQAASQNNDEDLLQQAGAALTDIMTSSVGTRGYIAPPAAISPVEAAKVLVEHGMQDKAILILEHALLLAPNQLSVIEKLAELQISSHQYPQAEITMQTLAALRPEDINLRRNLAHLHEQCQNWQSALDEWTSLIIDSVYPDQTSELEDLHAAAFAALQAQKPVAAMYASQRALSIAANDGLAYMYKGQAYIQQQEHSLGSEHLTHATQMSPSQPQCWLSLAAYLDEQGLKQQAIECLQNGIQHNPNHPQLFYTLGQQLMSSGNPSLALNALRQAVTLNSSEDSYHYALGLVMNELGRSDEALQEFEIAYNSTPLNPEYAYSYGAALVNLGRVTASILPLEIAIHSKTLHGAAPYLDYARAILGLSHQDNATVSAVTALGAIETALQIDPDLPESKAIHAEALHATGNYPCAIKAYQEALDTHLTNDRHWRERLSNGLAQVAYKLGLFDITIAAAQEAIAAEPHNAETYKLLSDAYLASNLFEDSLRSARTVLSMNIDDQANLAWYAEQIIRLISQHNALASPAYQNQAKQAILEAQNALLQAVQISPQRVDLLIRLSKLQQMTGDANAALTTITLVLNNDQATVEHLCDAAEQFKSLGDKAGAVLCLEKSVSQSDIQVSPPSPRLLSRLAEAYIDNYQLTSASETYEKAISIDPEAGNLYYQRAILLLRLGRTEDAVGCVETGISLANRDIMQSRLYFLGAWLYRQNGDIANALGYTQRGLKIILNVTGANKDLDSSLLLVDRLLIADMYRVALQPHKAYQLLKAEPKQSDIDSTSLSGEYLQWITLKTELELDLGYTPSIQLSDWDTPENSASAPGWLPLRARLELRDGDQDTAEQIYQSATSSVNLEGSSQSEPLTLVHEANRRALTSQLEAAFDFSDWKTASAVIQRLTDIAPNEPFTHLAAAQLRVLKAEAQRISENLDVQEHAPGQVSLGVGEKEILENSLEKASSLSILLEKTVQEYDLVFPITQIERWHARAQIAFCNRPLDQSYTHQISSAVATLRANSSSQPQTPAEAAALITAISLFDTRVSGQTTLNQILQFTRPHSRNPLVWFYAAMALEKDFPQDAFSAARGAAQLLTSQKSPLAAYILALLSKLAQKRKDLSIAQESIEAALSIWPDEPAWHRLAAQIHQAGHNNSAQIKHLEQATHLDPKHSLNHLELGKAYLGNNHQSPEHLNLAITSFEKAANLQPEEVSAWIWLARAQIRNGQKDAASRSIEQVLALSPNNSEAAILQAEIALQQKSYSSAHEFAQTAAKAHPEDPQTALMLAKTLKSLNRPAEALDVLESAIPISQDPLQLQYEQANLLRDLHGPDAALQLLTKLVSEYPNDATILTSLARSQADLGDSQAAIQTILAALKTGKSTLEPHALAHIHFIAGTLLRRAGQQDQAIQHLSEAVIRAPEMLEAYLELGLARKERREYQQALQVFEQATRIAPHDPRPHYLAGLALKEGKDYKRSELMLRQAAHLAPDDVLVRRQLAQVVALNVVQNLRV